VLYTRLLLNAVINPLTALYSVPNGHLWQQTLTGDIVQPTNECFHVMQAIGAPSALIEAEQCSLEVQATAAACMRMFLTSGKTFTSAACFCSAWRFPVRAPHAVADAELFVHVRRSAFACLFGSLPPLSGERADQIAGHLLQRARDAGVPVEGMRQHWR